MAPVTRRAANTGVSKTVHRKRIARHEEVEDWDRVEDANEEAPVHDRAMITDGTSMTDLRNMADRVGREVDTFAETLDKYNSQLHSPEAYEAAHGLCTSYKSHADGIVKKLQKRHQLQRMQEMKESFAQRATRSPQVSARRRSSASKASKHEEQGDEAGLQTLKQWQAEADTWELFRIMLELRYTVNSEDARATKEAQLQELGPYHRYSDRDDLWDRFTIENDSAKEKFLVLKWLENAADRDGNDMNSLADELAKKSSAGTGLWLNGWMETREKIKGAKRMGMLTATNTQPEIRRTDGKDLLITSLDPDAPSRQSRTLEKEDAYSERSLWMTCWEMLRRGKSWNEVYEWCLERNQGWRALSMGLAGDASHTVPTGGAAAGALWRRMCHVAAKSHNIDEYEAAVYGLLSGDLDTVQKVCQTWNDHLYAQYNSSFLAHFDRYVLEHSSNTLSASFTNRFGLSNTLQRQVSPSQLARDQVTKLAKDPKVSKEAQSAMKLLQGSLLGDTFADLCTNVGNAISDAAWLETSSVVIRPTRKAVAPGSAGELAEAAISEDYDALRITAHMLTILRVFHAPLSQASDTDAVDNVIAAYIQFLRAAGKRDLAPLYASQMAKDRAVSSLAQVISDIEDAQESMEFIKLMDIYKLDTIAVLNGQYKYMLNEALIERSSDKRSPDETQLRMLENTKDELYPGQRIKMNFLPGGITNEEQALVNSLSVYYLIEGQWAVTFEALAYACRKLLANGQFAAAFALVDELQFEQLSKTKTASILGKAINIMDPDGIAGISAIHDRVIQAEFMQKLSRTYYELTLLIRAVEALNHWRQVEHEHANKLPRPSVLPIKVKQAYDEVTAAIEPLLHGILQNSRDDEEAADLLRIRTIYLPEILIAYNTVLCTAGHMISRDELLSSMELSTIIANEASGLSEAFVVAGRVKELVKSFAETSKIMLKLSEMGKTWKEKKGGVGRSLAIWEISG